MHWFLTVFLQFALFPISLAGQYVIGRKLAVGWLMGLGTQVLWIAFALAIHKPGLISGSISYACLYAFNYWKWHRPEQAEAFAAAVRRTLHLRPRPVTPPAPDVTPLVGLLRDMDAMQQDVDSGGGREVAWYYFRGQLEAALGLPLGALDTETEPA